MAKQTKIMIKNLLVTSYLGQLSSIQIKLIVALRISILAYRKNIDVKKFLRKHFNDEISAFHFNHLIETINEAWPEPIHVHNPCCQTLSYDEMLMIDLISAANSNRTQYFHGLLCEMLSQTYCHRLHYIINKLIQYLNIQKAAS